MVRRSTISFLVLAALIFAGVRLDAATYTVDDDGPADFSTIQAAINFASAGDTVYVERGTYNEAVTMKDLVNLYGAGPHVTTIDGGGTIDHTVTYAGWAGAVISGFRITGSTRGGGWQGGIDILEGPLVVRNNIIENHLNGIIVRGDLAKPTIVNNTIVNNMNGIIFAVRVNDAPPAVDVAFIYNTDITAAKSFQTFLGANGLSVDLIPLGNVAATDFSPYGVILVGSDTGSGYSWGTAAAVNAIVGSGRPVLGLGRGGASCFEEMGLSINWGNGWSGTENSIYIANTRHVIFNSPNRVYNAPTRVVQLYTLTGHYGEYEPSLSKEVTLLGREADDADHYPLVQEGKHMLWGFTGSPDSMTKIGKSLFINVIHHLHPLLPVPEKTHTIMNNIIANNTQTGIFYYLYAWYDCEILYNDLWGNGKDYHNNHVGFPSFVPYPGTGEIHADPLFDGLDYRLGDGSPCRDTGHPGTQYNDPDGTRNDMGVYGGPESASPGGFGGSGFLIMSVGDIPAGEIIQDRLDPLHGLADVNSTEATALGLPVYHDCPFGGVLWIHGLFGNADPVTHYQMLVGKWTGLNQPTIGECTPLNDSLTKVKYYIDDSNGAVTHKYISQGPKSVDGVDNLYEMTRGDMAMEVIGAKTYWTAWSQSDVRVRWNTRTWEDGKYVIRYRAYNYDGASITPLTLGTNDLDHLTLIVDNQPVDVNIHSVKYDSGQTIEECGIIRLGEPNENLVFNITASHPNGYLKNYWVQALYGRNKSKGYVVTDTYNGLNEGGPPMWHGVTTESFDSSDAQPVQLKLWETCAYQFRLHAVARTTDGRSGYIYWDNFYDHYYLDVGDCSWCGGADINRSGEVDWLDFMLFSSHWLDEPCGPVCE